MKALYRYARAYAGAGIPVFPLIPRDKRPATKNGFKDASADLGTVTQWWTENPHYNIGLPVLPGSVVIDTDPRHNPHGLEQLENRYLPLPATTTCISGRGDDGKHIYLKVPDGVFTDRNLPDGIDIRVGGKHYLVAPPSIHPDTGGHYYWDGPEHIADCPRWLLDLIRPPIKPVEAPNINTSNTGAGLIKFVSELQEGQRNHGLFWALCEAIKDGLYPTIKPDLHQAALSIGLSEQEINTTAASAERRMS